MTSNALSLSVLFALGIVGGLVVLLLSHFLGQKRGRKVEAHHLPYECGLDPIGSSRKPISVKFFLIAVQFIIFDIEVLFLYPWAHVFRDFVNAGHGFEMLIKMFIFLGILFIGFIYVWMRGALEWEK